MVQRWAEPPRSRMLLSDEKNGLHRKTQNTIIELKQTAAAISFT